METSRNFVGRSDGSAEVTTADPINTRSLGLELRFLALDAGHYRGGHFSCHQIPFREYLLRKRNL